VEIIEVERAVGLALDVDELLAEDVVEADVLGRATRLPFFADGTRGMNGRMSPLWSAATRFSRQIATGFSSVRTLRQAGSQGRSQVRPRMPGNTLESQLSMYASV
jgi:hypothetical protein